jgi:hypothetical protein
MMVQRLTLITDEENAQPSSTHTIQDLLHIIPGLSGVTETTDTQIGKEIITHDSEEIKNYGAHLKKLKEQLQEEYNQKKVHSCFSLSQLLVYLPGAILFACALGAAYGLNERNNALGELQHIRPTLDPDISCFDLNERQTGGCIQALTDLMLEACAEACDSLSFNRNLFIMLLLLEVTSLLPVGILFTAFFIANNKAKKSEQEKIDKYTMECYSLNVQSEIQKTPELSLTMTYAQCMKKIKELIEQNKKLLKDLPSPTKALVKKIGTFTEPQQNDLETPLLKNKIVQPTKNYLTL